MIKCQKCKNTTKFKEIVLGAELETEFTQKKDGNFVKGDTEHTGNDTDVIFECGVCGQDLTQQHNAFLDKYLG